MNDEVTELQKSYLRTVVNDARQRVLFFYSSMVDEHTLENIEIELNSYTYGFDLDYEAAGYCDGVNRVINVTRKFLNEPNYEQQVGIMVHEMNHAISYANKHNYQTEDKYEDADYVSSYKLIEEGLADVTAELIMNYYYDKKMPRVNYEPYRANDFFCGYPYFREIIKSILAILELQGADKDMIKEYYFGNKERFFECIIKIGGSKIFDIIRLSSSDGKMLDAHIEMFSVLEKNWKEAIEGNSHKLSEEKGYNNVYYFENFLISQLHMSCCLDKLISQLGIDIDNISIEDIQRIHAESGGLLERVIAYYVPSVIDKIIVSWIKNCKIEEANLIKKYIPEVYNLSNGKYYDLLIERILNEKNEDEFSLSELNLIFGGLNYEYPDKEELDRTDVETLEYMFPCITVFMVKVYPKMTEEQKELFRANYRGLLDYSEYKEQGELVHKKFLETFNISKVEEFEPMRIFELLNDHEDLIKEINDKNVYPIIKHIVNEWLCNYMGEPEYIFQVFPSAITHKELSDTLKKTWNYNDSKIDDLRSRFIPKNPDFEEPQFSSP